jgi:hypothetical protein
MVVPGCRRFSAGFQTTHWFTHSRQRKPCLPYRKISPRQIPPLYPAPAILGDNARDRCHTIPRSHASFQAEGQCSSQLLFRQAFQKTARSTVKIEHNPKPPSTGIVNFMLNKKVTSEGKTSKIEFSFFTHTTYPSYPTYSIFSTCSIFSPPPALPPSSPRQSFSAPTFDLHDKLRLRTFVVDFYRHPHYLWTRCQKLSQQDSSSELATRRPVSRLSPYDIHLHEIPFRHPSRHLPFLSFD